MRIYLYDLILKKEIKIKINFDILCTQKKKKKKKTIPTWHEFSPPWKSKSRKFRNKIHTWLWLIPFSPNPHMTVGILKLRKKCLTKLLFTCLPYSETVFHSLQFPKLSKPMHKSLSLASFPTWPFKQISYCSTLNVGFFKMPAKSSTKCLKEICTHGI